MIIDPGNGKQRRLPILIGGLAILPFVFAIFMDWLLQHWPSLYRERHYSLMVLYLIYVLGGGIFQLYKEEYSYEFPIVTVRNSGRAGFYKVFLITIAAFLILMVSFLVDFAMVIPVRLIPLTTGIFMPLRGADWYYKNWRKFGLTHGIMGTLSLGISTLPWYGGVDFQNHFINGNMVLELFVIGCMVIGISIMEHLIVRQVHASRNSPEITKTGSQISSQQTT